MALYSYNGVLLPHIRCTDNDLLEEATILWRADGTYRFANSGYMATSQVYNHDPVSDMIYAQHGTHDVYELQDGAWVRRSDLDFGIDTPVFPASDVLYCNAEIETRKIDYLYPFGTATYWPADEPGVLVSDDNYTLEATYSGGEDYEFGGLIAGPGVTVWGATGVIVGAQIRDNNTGEVTDISDKATYSIYSVGAGYAHLDGSRQVIVAEDCPLDSIGVEITWAELPGQTASITIYKKTDPGEDPDDPDKPDVPVDPEEPEATAEELRMSFWKGFGSGVGMYGGGVTVSGEAVATSGSGGSGGELAAAFWKGFSCGAAMYGGGKQGAASPAEPDSGGDSDSGSEDTGGEEEIPNALSGTWVLSESLSRVDLQSQTVNFNSNGAAFVRFYYNGVALRYGTVLTYTDSQTLYPDAYIWSSAYGGPKWANEAFRTVDFGDTPQVVMESFYTWFKTNAVRQP